MHLSQQNFAYVNTPLGMAVLKYSLLIFPKFSNDKSSMITNGLLLAPLEI